jgi:pyridoxine 4-dehydrogenase
VSPALASTLTRIAQRDNVSVAQLSLAWILQRSPVLLPIPGTSKVEHLEENVAAASLKIEADTWNELESLTRTP